MQIKLREMKPGILSKELKEAIGMPEGALPPWLINMQVFCYSSLYSFWYASVCLVSYAYFSCYRDMAHRHRTCT